MCIRDRCNVVEVRLQGFDSLADLGVDILFAVFAIQFFHETIFRLRAFQIRILAGDLGPVSYTHLDVYKRQRQRRQPAEHQEARKEEKQSAVV